ncbi:winged helix-turn-helix domain-containing protein [Kineosporia rhizophila]|uniref:ArsR/SmtB family transcription factor n=1 Tax=Kineosporia TaxID=49184 RepID=UPI001E32BBE6|nr:MULTISPECIES: winged helix-turn-helix domain-containing protein [Kineosporia]MCE0534151.1 winged helix-turn-helix domain-containing protein [Kineosporia rhizophila]GLY13697.1 transcriptional regulator [Kineosporia sp. NBRC 101677]
MQIADVNVAAAARLLADASRAAMLTLLLDGRAHPAGALAEAAGIGRPAASAHLKQLVAAGYLEVVQQGRHRYYRISRPEVATAVESLAAIAPGRPVRSLRQSTAARRLAEARTCYDHLAGRAGVALRDALLEHQLLDGLSVTSRGEMALAAMEIDVSALGRQRRPLLKDCLDWTERRPHLAGALAAALLSAFTDRGWLNCRPGRRVEIADWANIQLWLGCSSGCHSI